jgi:predicted ribosomally synthesized peptide with SipW-like signal peptide
MKSRMLISMLVIALAAAAIGGATMAWFTDEAEVPDVTFTAGTVIVNVDEDPVITTMEDRSIENVNPGDCATVCWNILNKGTKRAELRVKVDSGWVDPVQEEKQVVFFAPKPDSGWVMYEDEDGLWLYYINGPVAPVAGTNGDDEGVDEGEDESDEPEGVKLCLVVGFDGPSMDNRYQGLSYSIGGTVYAVQATNGAPEDLWGEAWEEVKSEGYSDNSLKAYFLTGNGASMPCWNGGTTDPDPEPTPPELDRFEVSELEVGPKDFWGGNVPVTATITAYDTEDNVFDFNGSKNVNIVVKAWGYPPKDFSETVTVTFNSGVAYLNTSVNIDGYSLLDSGHTVTVVD